MKLGQHPANHCIYTYIIYYIYYIYGYINRGVSRIPLDLPLPKFAGKPERYPWYVEGPGVAPKAYIHNYTIPKPPWNSHKLILNIAGLEEQFLLKKVFYFHVPAVVY